jgi:hypothetical protein
MFWKKRNQKDKDDLKEALLRVKAAFNKIPPEEREMLSKDPIGTFSAALKQQYGISFAETQVIAANGVIVSYQPLRSNLTKLFTTNSEIEAKLREILMENAKADLFGLADALGIRVLSIQEKDGSKKLRPPLV